MFRSIIDLVKMHGMDATGLLQEMLEHSPQIEEDLKHYLKDETVPKEDREVLKKAYLGAKLRDI